LVRESWVMGLVLGLTSYEFFLHLTGRLLLTCPACCPILVVWSGRFLIDETACSRVSLIDPVMVNLAFPATHFKGGTHVRRN
jgi:hypothetical protein